MYIDIFLLLASKNKYGIEVMKQINNHTFQKFYNSFENTEKGLV